MSEAAETTLEQMREGTAALLTAVDSLDEHDLDWPTLLPGWTRRHVMAHLAGNARALRRLATWARTGVETPMYVSTAERNQEIEDHSTDAASDLLHSVHCTAADLDAALEALTVAQWSHLVVTVQNRTVPATEIPWMRTREVWIHTVDLGTGLQFADFPDTFVNALIADVVARRNALGRDPEVILAPTDRTHTWHIGNSKATAISAPAAELAAWITGRAEPPTPQAPTLSPWL